MKTLLSGSEKPRQAFQGAADGSRTDQQPDFTGAQLTAWPQQWLPSRVRAWKCALWSCERRRPHLPLLRGGLRSWEKSNSLLHITQHLNEPRKSKRAGLSPGSPSPGSASPACPERPAAPPRPWNNPKHPTFPAPLESSLPLTCSSAPGPAPSTQRARCPVAGGAGESGWAELRKRVPLTASSPSGGDGGGHEPSISS